MLMALSAIPLGIVMEHGVPIIIVFPFSYKAYSG